MTWVVETESGKREVDTRAEAQDVEAEQEALGVDDVKIYPKDEASTDGGKVEVEGAEVVEMSNDGGNSTDTDDDESDDIELVGDGGGRTRVYCPACGRFSTKIYRCSGCGYDLAGETVDEWGGTDE